MRRFLFFYPGALGDLLLAAPVFQALHERYHDAKIECVGNLPQVRLLPVLKLVDQIYPIDDRRFLSLFAENECPATLVRFFRSFNAVVFWISNFRVRLTGVPLKIIHPRPEPHPPEHHAQYLYHSVQSFLNLPARDIRSFNLKNPPNDRPKKPHTLLIHPGSGSPAKNAPLEDFLLLARKWKQKTGGEITLLFGPADEGVWEEFCASMPDFGYSVIHSPNFENLVKRIQSAERYLGNDSGISHLAGLLNKRGLVFFRKTNPRIWRPLGGNLHPVIIA